jgi:DNA-binding response OmpR family regulator
MRGRILLVDDEVDVCRLYKMVLNAAGFECISY